MNQKPIDLVKTAIYSDDELQRLSPILADLTKGAKLSTCKEIVSLIKKAIKSKSYAPPQKLRALKVLNQCMLVGNVHFLIFAQKKVMSRFSILASYKKELPNEQRGEGIFGKESNTSLENRNASVEFLTYLLDCIKTWASEFGKSPDKTDSVFFTTYMKLKDSGVRFPIKKKNSLVEERKVPRREEVKVVAKKKIFVKEDVENILKQFEAISDEAFLADFVAILEEQEREIEIALQNAMSTGNEQEINMLLGLTDRVQAAIVRSRSRKSVKSNVRPSANLSPAYKSQSSEKSEKSPAVVFDIFDLDISPQGKFEPVQLPNSVKAANFATHQPINLNPQPNNFFPNLNKPEKEDPKLQVLQRENAQLKEALEYAKSQIQERDRELEKLKSEIAELKVENEQVLEAWSENKNKLKKLKEEQKQNEDLRQNMEKDYKKKVQFDVPEKQLEKKSTIDFDLDFILSPDQKKPEIAKVQGNSLPKLFEDSSSSEDEKHIKVIETKPESNLGFRMGNCMEMGVIFENESIQVGFQLKRQANELFVAIFIGNKNPDPITEITTELADIAIEAFPMLIQPIRTTDEVLQNTQATRMIKAQLSDFTSKVPLLRLSVKHRFLQNYSLKLPITITRFIEARQELPTSIWNEWKKLVFEEDQSVIALAVFASIVELCSFLCLGTAFRVYTQQDIEELPINQVVAAGQMGEVLVMFSVTVIPQGGQANFTIRCRNNHLRNALAPLIKQQIAKD